MEGVRKGLEVPVRGCRVYVKGLWSLCEGGVGCM